MSEERPSLPKLWLLAARPKTLPVSIMPVVVGTALAWDEVGAVKGLPLLAALLCAVLIQIATNLHNDAADHERGADTEERVGPARVTAQGWLSARAVRRGALLCFALAVAGGVYLVTVGGWPIMAIGFFSVVAGWAYSGGFKPIAYTAMGEVFVFLFFGLAAVVGSHWLQALAPASAPWIAGAMMGFMAAAVLMVNNYRDLEQDEAAGRRTLAIVLGRRVSKTVYSGLMLAPYALVGLLVRFGGGEGVWLALLVLPLSLLRIHQFRNTPPGPAFNVILAGTAQTQALFGVIVAFGVVYW